MTDLNPSPGTDGLRRKERISMAREICLHRGENPDAVDRQGNERWENYEPLAGACIREAERLFALRAPAQRAPGWIDQNHQIDRYGVALMMVGLGCADPAGLATRVLSEFGVSLTSTESGSIE